MTVEQRYLGVKLRRQARGTRYRFLHVLFDWALVDEEPDRRPDGRGWYRFMTFDWLLWE